MSLIQRDELRLAVTIGLAAGLGSVSSVPDGYFMPLTIAAVMAGSYGSSYDLGVQRVLCTLLGAVVLAISQPALVTLPFPLGLALVLGLIRWIGGRLGLRAGYKIAGLVVIMGWTMPSATAINMWLGLKIIWTSFGVVLALLSLNLFWPSTAIRDLHRRFERLLLMQREALLEQQVVLRDAASERLLPQLRKQRHRELMQALIGLQTNRPPAILELGVNPYAQPLIHLWQDLERCCSGFAGCITALRALREPPRSIVAIAALHALHDAEAETLAACSDQLACWMTWLQGDPLGEPCRNPGQPLKLQRCLDRLRRCERAVLEQDLPANALPQSTVRQLARRSLLCFQLGSLLLAMDRRWQELATGGAQLSRYQ